MSAFHDMVSMELDDDDKIDLTIPSIKETPDFPYGLRICLTEKEFEKLGIDPAEAFIGAVMHGHFLGRITSISANQAEGVDCCRVEVQIEDLAIESEDAENAEYE